jgi:glycosyltransferase involved in cell wall biosynthesis
MRVLYITSHGYLGSTASSLNAILQQLRPRGLEPVILFQKPGPWQQELVAQGIPCYFDSLQIPSKYQPFRSFWHIWRLIRLVHHEEIELIHCNEHQYYPLLRLVARWTGLPIISTLHWNLEPGFGLWAFRPPYLPACLQFLSRAQLEQSRPALPPQLGADRVKLLMSGLDIGDLLSRGDNGQQLRSQWGVDQNTVVIGTASAIKPRKRLEDFVLLISRLRACGLNVLGVIAGGGLFTDPRYQEYLKSLIKREQLEDYCLMIGFVNPITPFFQAIDISVNTSEMEILSMSLCEAMACGRPTIAYAVGGNAETVHDPWCVAPFGDMNALFEKAAKLVTDAGFRQRMGAATERFVRDNFDAPVLAARQAAIYEQILNRPLRSSHPAQISQSDFV